MDMHLCVFDRLVFLFVVDLSDLAFEYLKRTCSEEYYLLFLISGRTYRIVCLSLQNLKLGLSVLLPSRM